MPLAAEKVVKRQQEVVQVLWRALEPTLAGDEAGAAPIDVLRMTFSRMQKEATTRATPKDAKLQFALMRAIEEYEGTNPVPLELGASK